MYSISIYYIIIVWVLGRVNIGGHWRPYGMIYDDYDGQWYPGIDGGLSFPEICLTVEEKPQKKLNQENWPDRGSNPGRWVRGNYVTPDHSGGPQSLRLKYLNLYDVNIIVFLHLKYVWSQFVIDK